MPIELPNKTSTKEKRRSLLHTIGGGWYMDKLGQNLSPLKKSIIIIKNKKRRMK